MKAQTGLKIIFLGLIMVVAVIIFGYGYKYTVGMDNKMKTEGFMQEAKLPDDYSSFKMPNPSAERINCLIGSSGSKQVYQQLPVSLCPQELDKLKENRIAYQAFLLANAESDGFSVKSVSHVLETEGCALCYDVVLTDGFSEKTIRLNGLLERK